jgi:hypothetical protein
MFTQEEVLGSMGDAINPDLSGSGGGGGAIAATTPPAPDFSIDEISQSLSHPSIRAYQPSPDDLSNAFGAQIAPKLLAHPKFGPAIKAQLNQHNPEGDRFITGSAETGPIPLPSNQMEPGASDALDWFRNGSKGLALPDKQELARLAVDADKNAPAYHFAKTRADYARSLAADLTKKWAGQPNVTSGAIRATVAQQLKDQGIDSPMPLPEDLTQPWDISKDVDGTVLPDWLENRRRALASGIYSVGSIPANIGAAASNTFGSGDYASKVEQSKQLMGQANQPLGDRTMVGKGLDMALEQAPMLAAFAGAGAPASMGQKIAQGVAGVDMGVNNFNTVYEQSIAHGDDHASALMKAFTFGGAAGAADAGLMKFGAGNLLNNTAGSRLKHMGESAVAMGLGGTGMNLTDQAAQAAATGKPFDPEQAMHAGVAGALGGGLVGGFAKSHAEDPYKGFEAISNDPDFHKTLSRVTGANEQEAQVIGQVYRDYLAKHKAGEFPNHEIPDPIDMAKPMLEELRKNVQDGANKIMDNGVPGLTFDQKSGIQGVSRGAQEKQAEDANGVDKLYQEYGEGGNVTPLDLIKHGLGGWAGVKLLRDGVLMRDPTTPTLSFILVPKGEVPNAGIRELRDATGSEQRVSQPVGVGGDGATAVPGEIRQEQGQAGQAVPEEGQDRQGQVQAPAEPPLPVAPKGWDTVETRPEDAPPSPHPVNELKPGEAEKLARIGATPVGRPDTPEHAEAESVANGLGKRLIWYEGDVHAGMHNPSIPDAVFVNTRWPKPVKQVLAHELGHGMMTDNPELFKSLHEFLASRDLFKDARGDYVGAAVASRGEEGAKEYLSKERNGVSRMDEEGVTTLLGHMAMEPRVWRAMQTERPMLWHRFVDHIQRFLGRFTDKGQVANKIIETWNAYREGRAEVTDVPPSKEAGPAKEGTPVGTDATGQVPAPSVDNPVTTPEPEPVMPAARLRKGQVLGYKPPLTDKAGSGGEAQGTNTRLREVSLEDAMAGKTPPRLTPDQVMEHAKADGPKSRARLAADVVPSLRAYAKKTYGERWEDAFSAGVAKLQEDIAKGNAKLWKPGSGKSWPTFAMSVLRDTMAKELRGPAAQLNSKQYADWQSRGLGDGPRTDTVDSPIEQQQNAQLPKPGERKPEIPSDSPQAQENQRVTLEKLGAKIVGTLPEGGHRISVDPSNAPLSPDRRTPNLYKSPSGKVYQVYGDGEGVYARQLTPESQREVMPGKKAYDLSAQEEGHWQKLGTMMADKVRSANLIAPPEHIAEVTRKGGAGVDEVYAMPMDDREPEPLNIRGIHHQVYPDLNASQLDKLSRMSVTGMLRGIKFKDEEGNDRTLHWDAYHSEHAPIAEKMWIDQFERLYHGKERDQSKMAQFRGGDGDIYAMPSPNKDAFDLFVKIANDRYSTGAVTKPDLAQGGNTREGRAIFSAQDQVDKSAGGTSTPTRSRMEIEQDAQKLLKNEDAFKRRMFRKVKEKDAADATEIAAMQRYVDDKAMAGFRDAFTKGDYSNIFEAKRMADARRRTGTLWQQMGIAMQDRAMGVGERHAAFISRALTMSKGEADNINRYSKELDQIHDALIKLGYDLTDLTPEALVDGKKAAAIIQAIHSVRNANIGSKAYAYWVNSMLSGIKTHTVNTASNMYTGLLHYGLMRPMEATANLALRNPDLASWGEIRHLFDGIGPTFKAASQNFFDTLKLGMPMQGGRVSKGTKLEDLHGRAWGNGPVGRTIHFPGEAMQAADVFAKTIYGGMEAHAQAYREGVKQGLSGLALKKHIVDQVANLDSDAWQKGDEFAAKQTFTDKPSAIGQLAMQARNKIPALKYVGVGPFVKTADRLMTMGIKQSPLGLMDMAYKGGKSLMALKNGDEATYTKPEIVRDTLQQMVALATFGAVWNYVGTNVTGAPPNLRDRDERRLHQEVYPPYSIKVPGTNKWVSYARIEPLRTMLGTTVGIVEEMKAARNGKPMGAAVWSGLNKVGNMVKDSTFLQSMGDLMEALQGGTESDPAAERYGRSFVTSWVPNIIRQPARAARETVGDGREFGDVTQGQLLKEAAFPWTDNSPDRIDSFGMPITKHGRNSGTMAKVSEALSPIQVTEKDVNPISRELAKYNDRHPDKPVYLDTLTPGAMIRDIQDPAFRANKKADREDFHVAAIAAGKIAERVVQSEMAKGTIARSDFSTKDAAIIQTIHQKVFDKVKAGMRGAMQAREMGDTAGYQKVMQSLRAQME